MRGLVLAALLLSGCAESQEALQDARDAVRKSGEDLQRVRDIIVAACTDPAPEFWPELVEYFNKLQASYTVINENIP